MPGLQSSLHHAPCLEVGDIRTGCLRRRLEFGHDRDHRCWALHNLHVLSSIKQQVRVTNFTLSLRPRESVVSIAAKAGDSTICTKMQTDNFSSIGNRVGSFHDKGGERLEIIDARTDTEGSHATHNKLLPRELLRHIAFTTALIWT